MNPKTVLCIKTDQKEAFVGLSDENGDVYAQEEWGAFRELSDTLLLKIEELLEGQSKSWKDLEAIVVFSGPGSFTGLRIGATVAATLAYSQNIPLSGTSGGDWIKDGLAEISKNPQNRIINLNYGGEANITTPRK